MIYRSIVGSASYGLESASSDVDIAIVDDKKYDRTLFPEMIHPPFVKSPYEFKMCCHVPDEIEPISWDKVTPPDIWKYQWFFPHQFCVNNELVQWMIENREGLMSTQRQEIYLLHMFFADNWLQEMDKKYRRRRTYERKCIAYAIHFYDMLYNYASGMTFTEAYKASEKLKDNLLAIRTYDAPLKLVIEEKGKAYKRVQSVEKFYQEPKVDYSIVYEFRHMVDKAVEQSNISL